MSKELIATLGALERRMQKERRVLIVDDAPLDRQLLSEQLNQLGCVCVEAGDCKEACDKIGNLRFDVCIMDLRMPGKDGLSCAREIKKISNVRVVLYTGYPEGVSTEDLKDAGILTLLSKPSTFEDLQRMLREFNL